MPRASIAVDLVGAGVGLEIGHAAQVRGDRPEPRREVARADVLEHIATHDQVEPATQVEGVEAAEGAESDIAGRPESVDDIRTRIDAGITHGGSKPAERRPPRGFAAPDIEHGADAPLERRFL